MKDLEFRDGINTVRVFDPGTEYIGLKVEAAKGIFFLAHWEALRLAENLLRRVRKARPDPEDADYSEDY